ncbi:MAG: ATP-binding protein [Eubacterium sp.]|nr:ATP-binding protein [Eubacterium sp.]
MVLINFGGLLWITHSMTAPLAEMEKHIKAVEKKNREIENKRSEFVANVSHELKTPLTSISGFIETLQNGAVDDPEIRNRFIDIIAIETERLKRLINDILLLSDIEGNIHDVKEDINVFEVTEHVFALMEPIAKEKNITMINDVNSKINLTGSEDKFKQMLVNLVENGIKYGVNDGMIKVIGKEDFKHIHISVIDNGIGIEKKDLDRVAERFYRVDKSRAQKAGGTGLGLSIVKHTAALFNGELKVKSTPGKGSEFIIKISK